jgi:hypothetical protein
MQKVPTNSDGIFTGEKTVNPAPWNDEKLTRLDDNFPKRSHQTWEKKSTPFLSHLPSPVEVKILDGGFNEVEVLLSRLKVEPCSAPREVKMKIGVTIIGLKRA